jgi:hypothetical protein
VAGKSRRRWEISISAQPFDGLGSKRKCRRFHLISALPHKADINCRDCQVRFVPKAEVAASFDHLVGQSKERRRYFDANCAGGLQIDRERQQRGVLKWWQISNFCAFQNAVSILRNPAVVLFNINSIGYQRPRFLPQTGKYELQATSAICIFRQSRDCSRPSVDRRRRAELYCHRDRDLEHPILPRNVLHCPAFCQNAAGPASLQVRRELSLQPGSGCGQRAILISDAPRLRLRRNCVAAGPSRVVKLGQLLQQSISLSQVRGRFGGRKFRPRRYEQVSCLGAPTSAAAHEQAREADRGPQFPADCPQLRCRCQRSPEQAHGGVVVPARLAASSDPWIR